MERIHPTPLRPVAETSERTLLDVIAAIELVAAGAARRIVMTGLPDPEIVAGDALAYAQGAGVAFRLTRTTSASVPAIEIGPIER